MLFDAIATNYSLWLWVPACAGTTSGEWRRGELFQPSLLRQTQSVCACERSEAIDREAKQKAGLLRCARNDDINGHTSQGNTHFRILAARMRPSCARGFCLSHGKGVGNAGCRRTRSLACKIKKHT